MQLLDGAEQLHRDAARHDLVQRPVTLEPVEEVAARQVRHDHPHLVLAGRPYHSQQRQEVAAAGGRHLLHQRGLPLRTQSPLSTVGPSESDAHARPSVERPAEQQLEAVTARKERGRGELILLFDRGLAVLHAA